jgi:hypothetical protein
MNESRKLSSVKQIPSCRLIIQKTIRLIEMVYWTLNTPLILLISDEKGFPYDKYYNGADKSLARTGRKQATATEDFDFHISYLLS